MIQIPGQKILMPHDDERIARAIKTARAKASATRKRTSRRKPAPKQAAASKHVIHTLKAPAFVPRAKRARTVPGRGSEGRSSRRPVHTKKAESSSEEDDDNEESLDGSSSDESDASSEGSQEDPPTIDWPAAVLIVGKKFAGKTNLIRWLIPPKDDRFDNVFLFTITQHKNNLNDLVTDPDMILESVTDKFFEHLLKHQKETNARTLLIFDDIVGMKGLGKQMPIIKTLAASGRNFNISIIFSTQDVTEVATTFRRNAEYFFFGHNGDGANETLAKQLAPPSLGRKAMFAKLNRVSEDNKHEFLFIDERSRDFDTISPPDMGV